MAAKPFEILIAPNEPLTFDQAVRHYGLKKAQGAAVRAAVLKLVAAESARKQTIRPRRRLAARKK